MRLPHRPGIHAWMIVAILAIGFLAWTSARRAAQVKHVSSLAGNIEAETDPASPTGNAGGIRELLVPGRDHRSYQWIVQTQQMLTQGEWRVRSVDYDNAPFGREVDSASPYRWWLGLIAWCDHLVSGRPLALSVEHAALSADPLLHVLLLAGTVILVARRFGATAAALVAVGMTALFPFVSAYLPGRPDDHGLALACGLWSVLLLLAGIDGSSRRWFFAGGVAGGLGLWINAPSQLPILAGIALGGLIAAGLAQRRTHRTGESTHDGDAPPQSSLPVLPWRSWALGGASTSFVAYLLEYFPAHMDILAPQLHTIHPLHAIAWWGAGELLYRAARWTQHERSGWSFRDRTVVGLAIAAVAALPLVTTLIHGWNFFAHDPHASRLTGLSGGLSADGFKTWIKRDGLTTVLVATCLPLLLVVPAGWLLARRAIAAAHRTAIAVALGPVLFALVLACMRLRWWNTLDALLLALIVAVFATGTTAAIDRGKRWLWSGGAILVLLPGFFLLWPPARADAERAVTEVDLIGLVERDLAHWLARQAGPGAAVVLAPPKLTVSLFFHGGMRGLMTPYPENKDGFSAAVRIAGATSVDEAHVLSQRRELSHIIIPSWDSSLDEVARMGSNQPENSLLALLQRWLPPRWLRPVPYHLPVVSGFEGQSVLIYEVVDVQDNATALSRLAEYFIEMRLMEQAGAVGRTLEQSFPAELTALIARAQIAMASGDDDDVAALVAALQPPIARGDELGLPWDRRVSLALVLAQGRQIAAARAQIQRCLADIDEPHLRSLTTFSLYRLQVLLEALEMEINEPPLRELARDLLPVELRGNF